jgi:hypothetical protein
VIDPIRLGKVLDAEKHSGTIVGDYLLNCSPSTQYFFEYEVPNRLAGLGAKFPSFWVGGKRAPSVDDVPEAAGSGHDHGVDVDFSK